ncbi:ABC transporter substrate-binding protein [Paenibacillus sp. strain BS8-2]
MEKAKTKMLREGASIKQISREVGYSDELYFSKKFKHNTGLSPTLYMKGQHMRIASYNYPITGQLLALQIMPQSAALDPDWTRSPQERTNVSVDYLLQDDSHDRRKVWEANERVLVGTKPDLIIGADYIQEWERSNLKQIADTRIIDWCRSDWRLQLGEIADIVSRRPVADRWLEGYDHMVRQTKEGVRDAVKDDTILPLLITESDYILFGSRNLADVLFHDLGLVSGMQEASIRSIAPEELAVYDAARIVVSVGEDAIAQARWRALQQSELWRSLRAVRMGRVHRVPLAPWFEYSAFAHQRILELAPSLFSEL